jgi:outer membrane immunogenic protein
MRNLVIAATALAFAGAAHAADMPLLKAPPAAAPTWTGFYIGVNGGGSEGTTQTGTGVGPGCNGGAFYAPMGTSSGAPGATGLTCGPASMTGNIPTNIFNIMDAGSNSIHTSGAMAGGQVGYLLQAGSIVGGLEIGFDWWNAKGSATNGNVYTTFGETGPGVAARAAFNGVPYAFTQNVSTQWLFTFLGRIGFDLGAWYPYVTAGFAAADLKYSNAFADGIGGVMGFSSEQVKPGIAAGAGLEWRWDSHWSLRGEYLYIEFSDINGFANVSGPASPPGSFTQLTQKATFSQNIGRAALSYKF